MEIFLVEGPFKEHVPRKGIKLEETITHTYYQRLFRIKSLHITSQSHILFEFYKLCLL